MGACTRRSRGWLRLAVLTLVLAATAMVAVAPTAGAAGSSGDLTAAQRRQISKLGRRYDQANRTVISAFEAATVVPRMKRWHAATLGYQKTLTALGAALPAGACRTAVDSLSTIEVSRNERRLTLIRDYRKEDFGLVNADVVAYAKTALDSRQADGVVLQACGVSPTDPTKTAVVTPALDPAQREAVATAQKAYAVVNERYDAVFSLPEFVSDVQALQKADATVVAELVTLVGELPDGPCRAGLDSLLALERQQSSIRDSVIAAGQAGNLLSVFQAMDQYSTVNSTSEAFVTARKSTAKACGLSF